MTSKKIVLFLSLLLISLSAMSQSYTIRGTVRDSVSGETLIGVTIYDMNSGKGVVSNTEGRYSLTIPSGDVMLRFSYVGYKTVLDSFALHNNKELNVSLHTAAVNLNTVTIRADRVSSPQSSQMSAMVIPVEHIKSVPVMFGETDVLKALQLLPGVQSGTEGLSGIYVRGGGPDQNLFLLDGVPLYNVNHLGGFFSAFNADAIKNVTLYKGSFPAHFGGRLSSVLDITSNDGNNKQLHGNLSIGVIAAKVNLEGPLYKDKTTFNISFRRTYFDILMQPMIMALGTMEDLGRTNAGYFFYDLNAKVTHRFSDRSRLIASWYSGDDKIYARVKYNYGYTSDESLKLGYNWGNMVTSLRWNYELTPKIFMNVTGAFTRYRNDVSIAIEENDFYDDVVSYSFMEMYYKSGIRDITGKVDFDYQPNPDHMIKFGASTLHHIFQPDVTGNKIEAIEGDDRYTYDTVIGQSVVHANEITLFFEDDWSISETFKINGGINVTGFAVQGTFYPSVQPRLSGRVMLSDDLSIKAGYSYMTQYMHQLSNSTISLPTDLWVPVTARIEPMYAHQVAAGAFYNFKGLADLSMELYYKKMQNMLEYRDGASFFAMSSGWEDKVCMGDGWSYGVEFLAQRTIGKVTGWLGYTWSKTMRLFDREGQTLNNGEPFPAKYDRRHDLSIVINYKYSKEFDCSVSWVFSSGNVGTLAMQEYYDPETGQTVPYIENRNNFRMPPYHRMDIGVNFHKEKKHGVRTISLSVYNVYNRQNPFIVMEVYGRHSNVNGVNYNSSLMQMSLFPIIPSVSYSFKF
ncbi:MAG: TonB-dependent receptor [Bacteroidales bacterium]|nr:TonB-dependent receptor [Bacteroidales bacterium]